MDKFQYIQDLCKPYQKVAAPDTRKVEQGLKAAHIPFIKSVQLKTFGEYWEPFRVNDKVVIIPLRPDRKGIIRNCMVCYTL